MSIDIVFIDKTKADPSFPDVYKYHFPPFHRDRNKKEEGEIQKGKASNHYKRDLEAAKIAYANKTTESITSQKLGSHDF